MQSQCLNVKKILRCLNIVVAKNVISIKYYQKYFSRFRKILEGY